MRIITAPSSKGGTGKTSTMTALAQAGAKRGKRVLCIDLDPQGNFSFALGADEELDTINSYNLLMGIPVERVQENNGIDIIPSTLDLATLESGTGTARRLQEAIEPIKGNYDYIFIDTPAKADDLLYNALQCATDLIIPLEASIYCLQALYQINDICNQFKRTNPNLTVLGFILNKYGGRSNLEKQMKETIIEKAKEMDIPFIGAIRKGVAVEEAQALQQSLFEYAPKSNPAKDFMMLFDEIEQTNQ
jgi:chromosome partitioning protein